MNDIAPRQAVAMRTFGESEMSQYGYQAQKLDQARSALMAPHSEGEEQSYAHAFDAISLGFHALKIEGITDQSAKNWIKTIQTLMNTTGVVDTNGRGTFWHRASQLSVEERRAFSRAVDELAHWFRRLES